MQRLQPLCRLAADALEQLRWRVVFAESCTAGLVSAALGSIPGISEHLCGSVVTYRNRTKQDWLGIPRELLLNPGPVSEEVVTWMARGALQRTEEADVAIAITGHLGPEAPPALDGVVHIGVACKDPSVNDGSDVCTTSRLYRLVSSQRALRQQEATQQVLATLLDTMEVFDRWKTIRQGSLEKCRFSWDHHGCGKKAGSQDETPASPEFLFPGSFDPKHEGHRKISEYVERIYGATVEYELSVENVDKPALGFLETLNRLFQFIPRDPIWLTQQSTFEGKASLFPKATFVVGVDTIIRVGDPQYYQSHQSRQQAIKAIAASGCRFLVFGRRLDRAVTVSGVKLPGFCQLENLVLGEDLRQLCSQVPESAFRCDISSSELRENRWEQ